MLCVFRRRWGVLFDCYSNKAFFWELVVLLRRVVLVRRATALACSEISGVALLNRWFLTWR